MSTTIDHRVVEMRFDNSHFEKNTKQTMSTLDKLKLKLNLSGAAKGLENINTSANKVNMNGLSNALTNVQSKFSALEIMGVTALANITNSAVNAGKRIVSALTIEPVSDGWREYEMTLNAVQTTMAGTGKTAEEVEKELKKLDEYADRTVYSTADMLNNLPKFTNAGVKLENATKAMIGIANATALAGGDAGKASIAFYNLGQAIGTGYLTRMDYNSINNAGIATMEWKNQMVEAAIAAGTLKKVGEDQYKAGNKTLTLQQLFIDGLQEQWATTEVMMKVFGDYGDETTEIGKKSYAAAQDIKTFSMMMDSLKATAGTGWKDTWQIIFGGLDEAKVFWTGLSNFISGIITGMADFRNKLLESALGRSFRHLLDSFNNSANGVKKIVDNVKNYAVVVDEIIGGKWGNGQSRWDKLTEAGYDWAHAQNLVNEKLGNSLRRATKYKESQEDVTKAQTKTTEATAEFIVSLTKMSDKQLKAKGYTDEQIKALRELEKVAKKTGIPLKEFIENIDEIDGRYLLINGFKNLGLSLVSVFKSIGEAWKNAFPPMTGDQLFNIIAAFHKFSTIIRTKVEKNADELTRTLKGLFAIIDLITMVVGGGFKIAFTVLKTVLSAFNLDILDFTAMIGDAIVAVRDWIEENNILTIGITKAVSFILKIGKAIGKFAKELWQLPGVQKVVTKITDAFSKLDDITLKDITSALKKLGKAIKQVLSNINTHFGGVPGDILSGLANGLKNGAKTVLDAIINLAKTLIDKFKDILGIHSPSRVFFAIGGFIIAGLVAGLLSGSSNLGPAVEGIVTKIKDFFTNTNWSTIFSKIFSTGMSVGLILVAKNLSETISNFSSLAGGLGDALSGIGDVTSAFAKNMKRISKAVSYTIKSFGKVMNGIAFKKSTEGVKNLAVSLLILVGAIVILTRLDIGEMWNAVGVIAALAAILAGLTWAITQINTSSVELSKNGVKFNSVKTSLLSIGAALLMMGMVVKMMGKMSPDQMKQGFIGLAGAVIALGALLAAYGLLIKGKGAQNMDKAGKMIRKMASTLLLMVLAVKLISLLDWSEMGKGVVFIAGFTLFVGALMAVTKIAGKNVDKIGKMISKISWSLLLMAVVVKLISLLSPEEMKKGAAFAAGFLIFVGALVAITKIGKEEQIAKVGGIVFSISAAMLLMAGVVKLISTMKWDAFAKGAVGVAVFAAMIAGLLLVVKSMGPEAPKLAGTLIAMSVAIGVLAAVALVLSLIDIGGLAKGVIAVGMLGGIVALMLHATKGAQEVKGTLVAIAIAVGVMAAAIAVLSFIEPGKLIPATVALGVLLGMFALIESCSKNVTGAWATILAMTAVVVALGVLLIILSKSPIENALAASVSLSILLLSLVGALAILTVIGPMASAAYPAMLALAVFVGGILAVVAILGGIAKIPGVQDFLNGGMQLLISIGNGLGEVIGAFVKGVMTQISSGLPEIGANLSAFMTNLTPFITGAKMIDQSVLAGVGILAASIIALSVANLIEGVTSFLTFGSSFADLGTQLSMFMMNAMPFIMATKLIDPSLMEGVKTLAEAILILTGANLVEGIASFLTGGNSIADFGSELAGLGTSLNQFSTNLGTFDESKVTSVNCAANAIKTLAQAANEIPNEGGWAAKILGDNSLAAFGEKLPGLATHLNGFITNLGTFDDSKLKTVDCAGKAVKALAQAASEIPNEGGLWGAICGENGLAAFSNSLPGLATHLNGFITNLGTFDESKITTVDCACKAIKSLASAAKEIPNEGGLWAAICGDNSLATFGGKLPKLGEHISSFVSNLGSFSEAQVATVNSACRAIQSIAKLGEIDIKDTGSGLNSFGKNMVKFAKKIKEFVEQIGEVGSGGIDSAIKKTKELIEMAKTVANTNVDSLNTFGKSLKKVAKDGVKGFVKEFSGESPKAEAKKATKALLDAAIKGAESKKSDVKKKFKAIAEAAVDALSSQSLINDAKSAGKDLVKGFASGISENTYLATAKAKAMANKAEEAAREALDINSPSKVFREIGSGIPEGFAQGITMLGSRIKKSVSTMSNTAISGTNDAISLIAEAVNMDIDSQPTIRPVLDLSDVESGAGYLSSLLNNPSIGVMSNLNAISSGMNTRAQNGANGEVVSAINRLRKDISNIPGGDTYNFDGITYDDGSNIRDAVQAIVRAAQVERRT